MVPRRDHQLYFSLLFLCFPTRFLFKQRMPHIVLFFPVGRSFIDIGGNLPAFFLCPFDQVFQCGGIIIVWHGFIAVPL